MSELSDLRAHLDLILEAAPLADQVDPEGRLSEKIREEAAALRFWFARREDHALPALTVLFGCSGVGKSTLFNALTGGAHAFVSSVERPATRGAIVAGRPEVIARLVRDDFFPTFDCVDVEAEAKNDADRKRRDAARGREGRLLRLPCADAREGIVIDCPDFDTRVDSNRHIAERLLSWADRVVFVTSTERYADRSARPYLERIGRARLDAVFVLNMVGPGDEDLVADFARHLNRIEGLEGPSPLALPHRSGGEVAATPAFQDLLSALDRPVDADRGRDRMRDLCRRLQRELLQPLLERQRDVEKTLRALDQVSLGAERFEVGEEIEGMRAHEAQSKPILQVGPRLALKRLKTLLVKDRSASARPEGEPTLPDRDKLANALVKQAWHALDTYQVDVRTTLDGTPLRALLDQESLQDAELGRSEVEQKMNPLVDRLMAFSEESFKRLASQSAHEGGGWNRLKVKVLESVFSVLGVLFVLTVLPAIIHETLARMGMKDFINEIESVLTETRRESREIVESLVREQGERYRQRILDAGPDSETLAQLENALQSGSAS